MPNPPMPAAAGPAPRNPGHSKGSPLSSLDTRAGPWKAEMSDVNRRPTAITYKAIIGLAWSPTALGIVPLPGSLAAGPGAYGQISAGAVVFGCVVSLVGLLWPRTRLTGLTIEQVGLVSVSGGCLLYFVALLDVPTPSDAYLAMGLAAAVAVSAAVQWVLILRFKLSRRRVVVAP